MVFDIVIGVIAVVFQSLSHTSPHAYTMHEPLHTNKQTHTHTHRDTHWHIQPHTTHRDTHWHIQPHTTRHYRRHSCKHLFLVSRLRGIKNDKTVREWYITILLCALDLWWVCSLKLDRYWWLFHIRWDICRFARHAQKLSEAVRSHSAPWLDETRIIERLSRKGTLL